MSESPSIFLLDFDRTLIDSPRLRNDLWIFFQRFGIPIDVAQTTYKILVKIEDTHYSLKEHLIRIASTLQRKILIDHIENMFKKKFADMREYIYPDVIPWLEDAKQQKIILYLVTRGNEEWQGFKLRASNIEHYFSKIFYSVPHGEKTKTVLPLISSNDLVALIEDDIVELDQSHLNAPQVQTFYIRRYNDQPILPVSSTHITINSFANLNFQIP